MEPDQLVDRTRRGHLWLLRGQRADTETQRFDCHPGLLQQLQRLLRVFVPLPRPYFQRDLLHLALNFPRANHIFSADR